MEAPKQVPMVKEQDGVWTYTTSMPSPELHTYCFYVDGMRMLDPSNVYMIRDIATYTNYFLVDGELSQNYFVYEVPSLDIYNLYAFSRTPYLLFLR